MANWHLDKVEEVLNRMGVDAPHALNGRMLAPYERLEQLIKNLQHSSGVSDVGSRHSTTSVRE